MRAIKARKVVGGTGRGEAMVSLEPICFLGGVDVNTGMITEKGHPLEGRSIKDKVLIFPIGKGSTGGSYLIYETVCNGMGPVAVINLKADPVTVTGCIISEVPMVVDPGENVFDLIKDGDMVEVDGDAGIIRLE